MDEDRPVRSGRRSYLVCRCTGCGNYVVLIVRGRGRRCPRCGVSVKPSEAVHARPLTALEASEAARRLKEKDAGRHT